MKSDVKAIRKAWFKKIKCNSLKMSHIADNRKLSQHLKDLEPDPNVFRSLGHSTSGNKNLIIFIDNMAQN